MENTKTPEQIAAEEKHIVEREARYKRVIESRAKPRPGLVVFDEAMDCLGIIVEINPGDKASVVMDDDGDIWTQGTFGSDLPEAGSIFDTLADHIAKLFPLHPRLARYAVQPSLDIVGVGEPAIALTPEGEKAVEEEADDQEMQDGLAAAMVKVGEAVGILQRTPSGRWDEEDDSDNVTNDLISTYQTLGRIITNASIFHGKQTLRAGQSLRRVIDEVGAVANRVEQPVRIGERNGEQFVEDDGANACAARVGLPVVSDSDDEMGIIVDIYPEGVRVLMSAGACIFRHYGEFKVPQAGSAIDILTKPAKQTKKTK